MHGKAVNAENGFLFIQAPLGIAGKQRLIQRRCRPEQMPGEVVQVAVGQVFFRQCAGELRLKQEELHQRPLQGDGIVFRPGLQGGKFRVRSVQQPAAGQLSPVHHVQEGMGMSGLVVRGKLTPVGALHHLLHPIHIPQDQVHMYPVHHQPTAAVYPGAPAPLPAHQVFPVLIIQLLRQAAEHFGVQLPMAVINPDVHVRVLGSRACGSGTAQNNARDKGACAQGIHRALYQSIHVYPAFPFCSLVVQYHSSRRPGTAFKVSSASSPLRRR